MHKKSNCELNYDVLFKQSDENDKINLLLKCHDLLPNSY